MSALQPGDCCLMDSAGFGPLERFDVTGRNDGRETGIEPRDFQLGKLNRRLKIQTFASMGLIADDPKLWIPQYVRHRAKKGDRFHRRGGTPFNSLVGPDVVRSSTADSGFSSMGSPFRQKSRRRQTTPAHPVRQGRFRSTYGPARPAPRCSTREPGNSASGLVSAEVAPCFLGQLLQVALEGSPLFSFSLASASPNIGASGKSRRFRSTLQCMRTPLPFTTGSLQAGLDSRVPYREKTDEVEVSRISSGQRVWTPQT